MKVLLITAECGEPQFKIQKQQLKSQKKVEIKQVVISNLNLKESQDAIYSICIRNKNSQFNYFIKLDGDMTLTSENSIYNLCSEASRLGKERVTFKIIDYYTNRLIYGVHLLKPISIPEPRPIHEFRNDYWIETIKGCFARKNYNEVLHGFNPTFEQSIRFGRNRGEKAEKSGAENYHWRTIYFLIKNAYRNPNSLELKSGAATAVHYSALFKENTYEEILEKVVARKISNSSLLIAHLKRFKKPTTTLLHVIKILIVALKPKRFEH